ncbi:hypothetical protein HK096_010562, partial [Nowakowskiella sp. JEL0078]
MIVATLNAPIEFIKIQKQLEKLMEQDKRNKVSTNNKIKSHSISSSNVLASSELKLFSKTAAKSTVEKIPPTAAVVSEVLAGPTATSSAISANSALSETVSVKSSPTTSIGSTNIHQIKVLGSWDTMKSIVRRQGVFGLYSGYFPHLLREGLGTALYFSFYESLKFTFNVFQISRTFEVSPSLIHLISGGLAGTLIWVVIFPIDLVKSIVQREALTENPRFHTARQI